MSETPEVYRVPIKSSSSASVQYIHLESLDLSDNGYWKMQERILQTELNWVRRKLGKEPKRCAKCGEILS